LGSAVWLGRTGAGWPAFDLGQWARSASCFRLYWKRRTRMPMLGRSESTSFDQLSCSERGQFGFGGSFHAVSRIGSGLALRCTYFLAGKGIQTCPRAFVSFGQAAKGSFPCGRGITLVGQGQADGVALLESWRMVVVVWAKKAPGDSRAARDGQKAVLPMEKRFFITLSSDLGRKRSGFHSQHGLRALLR